MSLIRTPLPWLLLAFATAQAADVTDLTYTTFGNEVTITDCDTSAEGALEIPATIGGNPVTAIGDNAFESCTLLRSVTIPEGVTSIGNSSFRLSWQIYLITFPDSLTSIGDHAFYGCENLSQPILPDGLKSIGSHAFEGCYSLIRLSIPDGVTTIGSSAFKWCAHLFEITLPDGITSIESSTFHKCANLTSIVIPAGVTSISSSAFQECKKLAVISFEGSAPTVGANAFTLVSAGAKARVNFWHASSFGGESAGWNGLTVVVNQSAYTNGVISAGLTGANAAPTAIPFNDGLTNLIKFAFNMDLSGSDVSTLVPATGVSGLPAYTLAKSGQDTVWRVEFIRRKNSGISYLPQKSSSLDSGSFENLTSSEVTVDINAGWERVIVQEPYVPEAAPRCFYRIEISSP